MSLEELRHVAQEKRLLMRVLGKKPEARSSPAREEQRESLEVALLGMRAARQMLLWAGCSQEEGCWLRQVRQAIGMPAREVARRLGITKWEVFRLERAESSSRLQLASLRRAAEVLGCELVYALVPKEGTLEDLAEVQRLNLEGARERAQERNRPLEEAINAELEWRRVLNRAVRTELRKSGLRVR